MAALTLLLLLALVLPLATSFTAQCLQQQSVHCRQQPTTSSSLSFKRKGDGGDDTDNGKSSDDDGVGGWIQKVVRFINPVQRARLEKSYEQTKSEVGDRYMLRLLQPKTSERRHCITRLTRFLPDLTFETAGEIVDTATSEGASLVRVYNSLREVEYVARMLQTADPPLSVSVFDSKKGEVINI